jgi:hypothetical protein
MINSEQFENGERRFVTVVTTEARAGKSAKLTEDGTIEFESAGAVVAGFAVTHYVPSAVLLLEVLESLTSHQYIIPDFCPVMLDEPNFYIWTAKAFNAQFGENAAPKQYIDGHAITTLNKTGWEFGGWRVLDRDVDSNTPTQYRGDYESWLQQAETILPGLQSAPRVVWKSSKGRVCVTGQDAAPVLNCHTWVDCSLGGVEHTDAMRARLTVRATTSGLHWPVNRIDRATGEVLPGRPLFRTIFDISVWTIHRIIYAGAPTVGEGLVLLPSGGLAVKGRPLNLNDVLPAPAEADLNNVEQILNVKVVQGASGRLSFNNSADLQLSTSIEILGHPVMTVREFFRSEQFSFLEKYRCQSAFRGSVSWNGIIRKYVNGQVMHHDNGTSVTYWLGDVDALYFAEKYKSCGDENARLLFSNVLATMRDDALAVQIKELALASGLDVAAVRALRKAGTCFRYEAQHENHERRDFNREQIKIKRSQPSRDLATIKNGKEIFQELSAHWMLLLGKKNTDAITFVQNEHGAGCTLSLSQYSIGALYTFCSAFPIPVIQDDGSVEYKNPAEMWIADKDRRGVSKVVFEPGLDCDSQGALNLWTGWNVEPSADENGCALFLRHVIEVIAAGNHEHADYILNWLALRVQGIQYRSQRGGRLTRMIVAIVLRSVQGTGKGLFEQYLQKIFGLHSLVTARSSGLTGRFNWEFAHLTLLLADEAFFAGDRQGNDVLKSFLTEPTFVFEKKYADSVSLSNHCAVIMSSNKDFVVPADAGDRRICAFDVSDKFKGNTQYFDNFAAEMDGAGPSSLLGYLLNRDISKFDVTKYPRTEALLEQQNYTVERDSITHSWVLESIENGEYCIEPAGRCEWSNNPVEITRRSLLDYLVERSNKERRFSPPSARKIGSDLRKIFPNMLSRERFDHSVRTRTWVLPPIEEARRLVDSFMKNGGNS